MKYSILSFGLMANLALAAPTPTVAEGVHFAEVAKRASITDASSFNFRLEHC